MTGDYTVAPTERYVSSRYHGTPTVIAHVYGLDIKSGRSAVPRPPYPGAYPFVDVLELPHMPAVPLPAAALCSAKAFESGVDVSCLDDNAKVVTKKLDLATLDRELVERLERESGCVTYDVAEDIGTRDLDLVARQWRDAESRCGEHQATRHVPAILELAALPQSEWSRHEVDNRRPTAAIARLRIPSLGIVKELGTLGSVSGAWAEARKTPPRKSGVEIESHSDFGAYRAVAYQVGPTLFFNRTIAEQEKPRSDAGPGSPFDTFAPALNVAMQTIDLGCDVAMDFEMRILPPLQK